MGAKRCLNRACGSEGQKKPADGVTQSVKVSIRHIGVYFMSCRVCCSLLQDVKSIADTVELFVLGRLEPPSLLAIHDRDSISCVSRKYHRTHEIGTSTSISVFYIDPDDHVDLCCALDVQTMPKTYMYSR